MNNIVEFPNENNIQFTTLTIWVNWGKLSTGKIIMKQFCVIGIKDVIKDVSVIHPITEFILSRWQFSKYNTQRKHCNNLVSFLNFLLSNRGKLHIKSLADLTIEIAELFLNELSNNNNSRGTVKSYVRTLTNFFSWLSKQGITCKINENVFIEKENHQTGSKYIESPFTIHYPSTVASNKEHLLPVKYIPLLLEIAILEATPIAFGIYLQIFGGLRVGEIVNLKRIGMKRKLSNGDFLATLKTQNLRSDIKDSSGSSKVKKPRNQLIFQINDWGNVLFNDHISLYKDIDGSGALFVNRDGKAMTGSSYRQHFTRVKEKFIDFLKRYGNANDKILAHHLRTSGWSTHIGRGTFTNLIADQVENPFDLAFLRGDSNLLSALAYMANTERMRMKVENKIQSMHGEYIPRILERRESENNDPRRKQ